VFILNIQNSQDFKAKSQLPDGSTLQYKPAKWTETRHRSNLCYWYLSYFTWRERDYRLLVVGRFHWAMWAWHTHSSGCPQLLLLCTEQKHLWYFPPPMGFVSPGHIKSEDIKEVDCVLSALCINSWFQSARVFLWYPLHQACSEGAKCTEEVTKPVRKCSGSFIKLRNKKTEIIFLGSMEQCWLLKLVIGIGSASANRVQKKQAENKMFTSVLL